MKSRWSIPRSAWLMILGWIGSSGTAWTQEPGSEALDHLIYQQGAIVRGDSTCRSIALVFTGDLYADGLEHIASVLDAHRIRASFFMTGNFYRNARFESMIKKLKISRHYLGAHSDRHLLYCDWELRDSLLVTRQQFIRDLEANYSEMERFGIGKSDAAYFLPPYEWYNDSISTWTKQMGLQLINYTPGTLSHADYTVPGTPEYRSSAEILNSILIHAESAAHGLNGFMLLMHTGSTPERTDKFHLYLESLIDALSEKGYTFVSVPELLSPVLVGCKTKPGIGNR